MYKIIGADQQEYGPITADQIRQWITEGRVNGETKICLDGTQDWKPLAMFPEFSSSASPLPQELAPAPAKPPGTIKVFGILNTIFGGVGLLLCSPFSLAGILFASKKLGYSEFMTTWSIASAILNMIGAVVMLASGIGLLKMLKWSRRFTIYYAIFATAFALLDSVIRLTNLPTVGPNPEQQKAITVIAIAAGLAIGITYNVLLIIFLSKPAVKEALGEKD